MYTLNCETCFCLLSRHYVCRSNIIYEKIIFADKTKVWNSFWNKTLKEPVRRPIFRENPSMVDFIVNITYVLLLFLVYFSASDMKIENLIAWWVILKRNLVLNYLYLPKAMRQVQLLSGKFDGIALCSGAEWMCLLLRWKLWCAMSAVRACASCMGSPGGSRSCFTCVPVML